MVCGTVSYIVIVEGFPGGAFHFISSAETENFHTLLSSQLAPEYVPDFPNTPLTSMNTNPITCEMYASPSLHRLYMRGRNINRLSISCGFRHHLRTALPLADCHRQGSLGLAVWWFLTTIVVTCANILTSLRSTAPRGYGFTAKRTLSYLANAKHWPRNTCGTYTELHGRRNMIVLFPRRSAFVQRSSAVSASHRQSHLRRHA